MRDFFATFSPRQVADAHTACGVLLALTRDTRADVDAITAAAATAGVQADVRKPADLCWMYHRTFEDLDGHVFEAIWMDIGAAPSQTA